MTALLDALRNELESGPDAQRTLTGCCPLCGGDVLWYDDLRWQFYPDGGVYFVECEECPFSEQVDTR